MKNTNWYAVFTASRAEKRVKERLEQAGIENYLPVRAVEFVRDGQKRRLEIPVITGCIFVRVSEVNLPSVLSIWGVIADEQLESFKILNERAETLEIVNEGLPVGSAIRVLQGELAGVRGELIEVAGGQRVVVRIPYLIECVARVKV